MKRVVVLISGRGSNLRALAEAVTRDGIPARIVAVISNKPDAAGLAFAQECGIATAVVPHQDYASREAFDTALAARIDSFQPDLVILAGFMRILTEGFVNHYAGRLLNIHPSLLPAFTGLHTHRRALAEGVKLHGCTVHFVTPQLDYGPIVVQAAVPVLASDDEQALAARVQIAEHQIYPLALRWFAEDRLQIANGRVTLTPGDISPPPGLAALIAPGA